MLNRGSTPQNERKDIINILLVDDIPETRENIRKLLAFEEQEFKVIGSVGTGREALKSAIENRPDIVIMDINMPDMDGIQATGEITKVLPTAGVIMMSVNNDADYLRRAMQAGARNFLTKPIDPDELYSTIRAVYRSFEPIRSQQRAIMDMPMETRQATKSVSADGGEVRAGHVIVVYSPQGGAGCTTIATNIASGLMKRNIKVLLVDADTQFGDIGVFLKLQSQSNLLDLIAKVEDLDTDFFDSVVSSHESGLKVLLGPKKPVDAAEIETNPTSIARVIEKVADNYDFIVIDTGRHVDETLLSLTDLASKIVLVTNPTLSSVKNTKLIIDLFEELQYPTDKTLLLLNRVEDERNRNRVTLATESIEKFLKRPVEAKVPDSPQVILSAINKGVPAVAVAKTDRTKTPVKELMDLSDQLFSALMGNATQDDEGEDKNKRRGGGGLWGNK